jgi:hypothetical protein
VIHLNEIVYRGSPLEPCKSLSLLILIPLTHLSNIAKGNKFMNNYHKMLFARNVSHHFLKAGVHKIIKSDITINISHLHLSNTSHLMHLLLP